MRRNLMFSAAIAGVLAAGTAAALRPENGPLASASAPTAQDEKTEATAKKKETAEKKEKTEKKESGAEAEVKIEIDPNMGILEGKIVLKGDPPEFDTKVEVPANHTDRAHCVKHVVDERLLLGEHKELKNAVVSVEGHKPARTPRPRPTRVDNKNCLFVPHVQATTVGSTLRITNGDNFIHNTRGLLGPVGRINTAVPVGGKAIEKKLRKPGWGVFKCDFHPWMMAHIHVFPHDLFAVTRKDGTFRIVNIPPGTHKVRLWHEVLVNKTVEVRIEAGKTTRLEEGLERYKD